LVAASLPQLRSAKSNNFQHESKYKATFTEDSRFKMAGLYVSFGFWKLNAYK
jgi:hypothetical protein